MGLWNKISNRENQCSLDQIVRRTTSSLWDEEFDQFQIFEVDHESCLDLEIEIKNGEKITKGSTFKDFLDTPDPYVVLKIPGSSNSSQRTSALDNTVSPLWNQTFHFFLEPKETHILHVILMDANFTLDENLGEDTLHLSSLPFNKPFDHTFTFLGGSIVNARIKMKENKSPDLRFSLALCEKEKQFLMRRREKVLLSLQKLLGDRGPVKKEEVPVVAILGSGGGFRAMTCFSGCVKALYESGIFDCATYISGLSGSSWLISTLYANDNFPNISFDDVYLELKDSVTQDWKKFLLSAHSYVWDMISKYRKGQPVSFTDFFGHILGDVLLKEKKDKTLSSQQYIVSNGNVPFPLYTCLHAKAAVSCRAFSEWVEFSPYEIGIAKYGTFMKTEHFGSKFLCGKRIKAFPEFPLHFLQGVWGSAFTILIKRLVLEGGSHKDLVQILRDINDERDFVEKVEEQILEENSKIPVEIDTDSDDENDIIGRDDISNSSHDDVFSISLEENLKTVTSEPIIGKQRNEISDKFGSLRPKFLNKFSKDKSSSVEKKQRKKSLVPPVSTFGSRLHPPHISILNGNNKKAFSFDFSKKTTEHDDSTMDIKTSKSAPLLTDLLNSPVPRTRRLQRQGAIKSQISSPSQSPTISRRPSARWGQKRESLHNERENKSTFIQSMMKNSNLLNSRVGRAGEILNPFRGLSLRESFPVSPFSPGCNIVMEDNLSTLEIGPGCRFDSLDNKAKKLFIVDSGLAFNSPFPLLLRPQRGVELYLSFDFSQRPKDSIPPFKELVLAEKWAHQHKVPFPPIENLAKVFSRDKEVKEVYVFKHPTDMNCPVIVHFPIVNNKFQLYKSPGKMRQTVEEFEFGNFHLFDDPSQPYSSTNFVYTDLQYERLVNMSEFNTLLCLETIKDELAGAVQKRKELYKHSLELAVINVQKMIQGSQMFKTHLKKLSLNVNRQEGMKLLSSLKRRNIYAQNEIENANVQKCSTTSEEFYDALDYIPEITRQNEKN